MQGKQFLSRVVAFGAAVMVGGQLFAAEVIKLDFGRHDNTNGHATVSPDVNGNHWNNLSPTSGGVIPINTTFGPFITTTNQPTTLAKQRAANGHPEPYGISFMGIGNESWG